MEILTDLQNQIQNSKISETNIYPNDIIKVIQYSSAYLKSNPDICKVINNQLKILCVNTELNSEYAFCSMLANEFTLVVTREPIPGSIPMMTRLMASPKMIGFISYSTIDEATYLQKYTKSLIDKSLPATLFVDANKFTLNSQKIGIDVIVKEPKDWDQRY